MALEAVKTRSDVIIIGSTGAGKSTLGNLLIYGEEHKNGGFPVGYSHASETNVCDSRSAEFGSVHLTVVDSPGVPDTDRARSLQGYDNIVGEMRAMPQINAIIFMVAMGRTDDRAYADMRALFKQFNPVPCSKIMVCRISMPSQCDGVRRGKLEEGAISLISNIVENAGLAYVRPFILHNTEKEDVDAVRDMILGFPGTEMADATVRTHEEMVCAYRLLSKEATRLNALQAETNILRDCKRQLQREVNNLGGEIAAKKKSQTRVEAVTVMVVAGAALADIFLAGAASVFIGVPSALAGATSVAAFKTQISDREARKCAALDTIETVTENIEANEKEIGSGETNAEELKSAQEELEVLETLQQI